MFLKQNIYIFFVLLNLSLICPPLSFLSKKHKFHENRLHLYDLKDYSYLDNRLCDTVLSWEEKIVEL